MIVAAPGRPRPSSLRRRESRRGPAARQWLRRRRDTIVERQAVAREQADVAAALEGESRMPSSLRSKIHSGPVKRSCVSVAAIGSSHSGNGIVHGSAASRRASNAGTNDSIPAERPRRGPVADARRHREDAQVRDRSQPGQDRDDESGRPSPPAGDWHWWLSPGTGTYVEKLQVPGVIHRPPGLAGRPRGLAPSDCPRGLYWHG